MILAAADCAESENNKPADRKEAPRELKLAWQFEVYGLTFPASLMEAGLMAKMTTCLNVYKAAHERNNYVLKMGKTDSDFRKNYPQLAAINKSVKELREQMNGKS